MKNTKITKILDGASPFSPCWALRNTNEIQFCNSNQWWHATLRHISRKIVCTRIYLARNIRMLCVVVCRFMVERAPTSFVAGLLKVLVTCGKYYEYSPRQRRSEFQWIFISAPKWETTKPTHHWRSWKQPSYLQIAGLSVKMFWTHLMTYQTSCCHEKSWPSKVLPSLY